MVVRAKVEAWIEEDVDPASRQELRDLLARSDPDARAELEDRFSSRLQFGTAGLRATMGAGPNRMNRAVVIQASKGLVEYLTRAVDRPIVVVGNDGRLHSRQFAIDAASVVSGNGGVAILLPDPVPTPVLAFAVRHYCADAGVMVTASHNPACDNGYKVYLGGRMADDDEQGVQIISPADSEIAALIDATPPSTKITRRQGWIDAGPEILQDYVDAITVTGTAPHPIRIVHTAMHGVGTAPGLAALVASGFTDINSVVAQRDPDPQFPTVAFPNPEEPGAIDLAIDLARMVSADVVIANDPDADRCAAGVSDPRFGWRILHGDELGAALGEYLASTGAAGVFASSIVSSRLLEMIAAHHGCGYVRTLTGFKWMGRVPGLAYAYEEAIGYCVRPDIVRDKDGLSAAVAIARLVSDLKARGRTVMDLLDDLARRHGLHLSSQLSIRVKDVKLIPQMMTRLRTSAPEKLGESPVTQVIDLSQGWDGLPATDGLIFFTQANDRVIVRPSGTEPKVKCYLEVIEDTDPQASFEDLTRIRNSAQTRLNLITEDLRAIVV
ncbi:MAG: phospho-sugar mutase [Propionibacteriaceae bacterium]|nr:phospho-sugar mutase [Propionibacteriaceae bacterium]